MIGSIYKCKCGAEKKDANHWYVTVKGNGSVQFLTWEAAKGAGVLQLPETVHICGELHAHVELSEFFAAEMAKRQGPGTKGLGTREQGIADIPEEVIFADPYALTTNHCAEDPQQELPFAAEKEANESICVEFNSSGS